MTVPPTICHVVHSLDTGGAEILAVEFARRHSGSYRTVFACLDRLGAMGHELRNDGFRVEVLRRCPGLDLGCARRLRRFCARQQAGLIHAHQYTPYFYSALARKTAHLPILFTEHGRDYPDYRRWKRVIANRFLLRHSDRVVAVGQMVRHAVVANEGIPSERVEVVYNGIDVTRFDPARTKRDQVRRELGIGATEIIILQVARLNRLKDHPTALRAMARLISRNDRQLRLVLVGDGEERASLERSIDDLQLGKHVTLLGSRNDVPALLQAADVFLLSSVTEGIPLTLIEAMASGLPCVATRVGGTSELVTHGVSGLLTEALNPEALATELERLMHAPGLRQRMGRAARERAVEEFDDQTMHRRYERIYRDMLPTSRLQQEIEDLGSLAATAGR